MASPLIGIAGVNSLLFTAYGISKRIISPFPDLSLKQIAAAGAMAGAANAILASPGWRFSLFCFVSQPCLDSLNAVEMFKVRMQGQYGAATDKRLSVLAKEMWSQWGFRQGLMRGYWVKMPSSAAVELISHSAGYCRSGNSCIRRVRDGQIKLPRVAECAFRFYSG